MFGYPIGILFLSIETVKSHKNSREEKYELGNLQLKIELENRLQFMNSLCPTLFVLFEKSNFLREHHLLSCLPFKDVEVSKTTLK